ncbi:MAG: hypothetical protein ACFFBP_09000, partial [Promethearchaeota archaeon]
MSISSNRSLTTSYCSIAFKFTGSSAFLFLVDTSISDCNPSSDKSSVTVGKAPYSLDLWKSVSIWSLHMIFFDSKLFIFDVSMERSLFKSVYVFWYCF